MEPIVYACTPCRVCGAAPRLPGRTKCCTCFDAAIAAQQFWRDTRAVGFWADLLACDVTRLQRVAQG